MIVLALPCAVLDAHAASIPGSSNEQHITLKASSGQLVYDRHSFTVQAGQPIALTFFNASDMMHNVVICKSPGKGESVKDMYMKVARAAWNMSEPLAHQYVPSSSLVLFHTRLLDPGQSQTIHFRAPTVPGDYPYVCTFPGHAYTMNGVMRVVGPGSSAHAAGKPNDGSGSRHAKNGSAATASLTDVTYHYYDSDVFKHIHQLPDFNKLQPASSGRMTSDLFGMPAKHRASYYGVLYEATLIVPANGNYKFAMGSNDGARLWVDGKQLLNTDGVHPMEWSIGKSIPLTQGRHKIKLAYFNGMAGGDLAVVWSGPGLAGVQPLSPGKDLHLIGQFFLKVKNHALVERVRLPNASARAVAVGLPGGTSYCFETDGCYVKYAWSGAFLDVGPQDGYGVERGGRVCHVLGNRFPVGAVDEPLRLGDPAAKPTVKFLGYRRGDGPVSFIFSVDGYKVTQTIESLTGDQAGHGLRYLFTFDSTPSKNVFFMVKPSKGMKRSSSVGQWRGGVLEVPADQARQFSVTIVDP